MGETERPGAEQSLVSEVLCSSHKHLRDWFRWTRGVVPRGPGPGRLRSFHHRFPDPDSFRMHPVFSSKCHLTSFRPPVGPGGRVEGWFYSGL